MRARGRWPGLFGSLVDGVVQGYRARYTEGIDEGSVMGPELSRVKNKLFAEHDRLG